VSIFSSYRAEEIPRDQVAATDPYEGRGVFLSAPGMSCEEITGALAERMGATVPAVAWGGIGAWVDQGSTGISAELIRERWDGGRASERW
jgi:hypothetical protein